MSLMTKQNLQIKVDITKHRRRLPAQKCLKSEPFSGMPHLLHRKPLDKKKKEKSYQQIWQRVIIPSSWTIIHDQQHAFYTILIQIYHLELWKPPTFIVAPDSFLIFEMFDPCFPIKPPTWASAISKSMLTNSSEFVESWILSARVIWKEVGVIEQKIIDLCDLQ